MEWEKRKVSVIVPVYNVEKYLQQCLDSIRKQTYDNLQIILINDGSSDNSYSICLENQKMDSRIVLFSHENRGLSAVRNEGIAAATGEYIVFVDSDDYIVPDMVETLYHIISEEQADIVIGDFTKDIRVAEDGFRGETKGIEYFTKREALLQFYDQLYIYLTVCFGKIYRRELFEDILFPIGKLHEDEYVSWKLVVKSEKIVHVQRILYFYRENPQSITGKGTTQRSFDKLDAYLERITFFKEIKDWELMELSCYRYIRVYEKLCRQMKIQTREDRGFLQKKVDILKKDLCKYFKILTLEHRLKSLIKVILVLIYVRGRVNNCVID